MGQVTGSKVAQRELQAGKADRETLRLRDLAALMNLPEGRRFIFDIIDRRCCVHGLSYTGSAETYYREGRRSIGIELMKELQDQFSELYRQMVTEQFTFDLRAKIVEESARQKAGEDE